MPSRSADNRGCAGVQERALLDGLIREAGKYRTEKKKYGADFFFAEHDLASMEVCHTSFDLALMKEE